VASEPAVAEGADGASVPDAPVGEPLPNAPPLAVAGQEQRAAVGVPVRLDARASHDPEGNPLTYAWTWKSRPSGSSVALDAPNAAQPLFAPDAPGEYIASLTVHDGALDSAPDEVRITASASGPFIPYFAGTGDILELSTGETLYLAQDRRVHVWLLPEGYLKQELPQFDADAEKWWSDLQLLDVFSQFREAFVVWKLPIASAQHVTLTSPQQADTAFAVPMLSSGSVDSVPATGTTAARVWSHMSAFPFPAEDFYPAGGFTSNQAKRVLAAVLVLDPAKGASGYSGVSRRLQSPSAANQLLGVAFSRNTNHEFAHAFGRLQDEYIGDGKGQDNALTAQAAHVSNVVADPHCGVLPWSHLLDGSAINPGNVGLVGAFGTQQAGYHPELKCLMNGGHDNASVFGGDGWLRTTERLCNFCRELSAFRLYERTGVLGELQSWKAGYRAGFFERLGFFIPAVVPQQNDEGQAYYMPCQK
jgi:hypothetical protein